MAALRPHVCELCEAGCGFEVEVEAGRVTSIRPDAEDVHSRGFTCPKGLSLIELDRDPDRLTEPVRRRPDGSFEPISWDAAFSLVAERLRAIRRRHGRDAIAVYMGTPVVHKHGAVLMRSALLGALRTRNSTSAGSQDTSPRFAASHLLYGNNFSVPVPDIDRTDYLLCIGANPLVSNGSLLTAPNIRARLRGIRERGGKLVVVDPRRTETARAATEHVAIRPGGDAAFLFAMAQVLLDEGRVDRAWLDRHTRGFDALAARLQGFTPERVADHSGVAAATIRRLAREFAEAPTSAAYARLGVCNSPHATLASFAVDVLNMVAGRLGAVGGSMFATGGVDLPKLAALNGASGFARWRSRVRGLPETAGDIPASTLAEEMETAGPGQVRALVTFAGNPVLSTPNGRRLDRALGELDFMVSIDLYVNETTRHADVILPPCSPFSDDHVDFFFATFAAHNAMRWSPPVLPRGPGERADWEILLELAYRLGGGPTGVRPIDWLLRAARRVGLAVTPTTLVKLAMRLGPHRRLLARLRASPHGVDLGPLQPGVAHRVFRRGRRIDLAPPAILDELPALERALDESRAPDELLLIGRRDIRSNNSWMHNLPSLASGKPRCVLLVHPDDARRLGLVDGGAATLETRIHRGDVPVRVTDEVRPGVVSLPHGWGHAAVASRQRVAGATGGASANDWMDDQVVESVVGQSILNGVPVRVGPAVEDSRSEAEKTPAAANSRELRPAGVTSGRAPAPASSRA
jgi:anaerobic selenocysteine-containing dehydrogenase